MALVIRAASDLHSDCIEAHCGDPWSSVTFVPSRTHPDKSHPVAELARQVQRNNRAANRLLLGIGPGFDTERTVRADQFIVPPEYADRVADRHVLLVEDTWVSGAKIQSAAVALHDAGAAQVTALCVARWCRDDWPAHKGLLDSCTLPYDPLICPVTGGACVSP
jgi:phosphoribosylpyrophosphate synthetase